MLRQPVGEKHRLVLVEGAVVEDEQELAAIVTKPLDRVRRSSGKEPEVTLAEVVDEGLVAPLERGDARPALQHVCPLTLLVKVELAHRSGLEPHVHARYLGGNRQLTYGRLSSPTALFEPHSTVGKRPPQIG